CNSYMSSSSAGAVPGHVSRNTVFCVRLPASQTLLLVLLFLPQCAAVQARLSLTPAPAVPLQTSAPPLRFVSLT
ncbi:hypothetical protein GOODEAATRI_012909, partial [Goodea atripinnis]